MKKSETILKSLWLKRIKFLTRDELGVLCEKYNVSAEKITYYLLKRRRFIRILRGIYYVKSPRELELSTTVYSDVEMAAEAFKMKGITDWYLSLTSALKMLGATHEFFVNEHIFNDRFNRKNPMRISDSTFRFSKIKPSLFSFGIRSTKSKNGVVIRFSDLEKTILYYAYLKKSSGGSDESAAALLNEYKETLNIKKLKRYLRRYPKSVGRCIRAGL